jgi:hydroxyethylthiazole kinase-like uncharacterized protein yjeF
MYEADSHTIKAGTAGFTLMTRAGVAMAAHIKALKPQGGIVIITGPGNNGGDGWVIAKDLEKIGLNVQVICLVDPANLKGDAKTAFESYKGGHGLQGDQSLTDLTADDIIVDSLFGVGLDRPIEGAAAELIEAINSSIAYKIAVDISSGLNSDTGDVMGCAIAANETLTVQAMKFGHILGQGPELSGNISIMDIGINMRAVENPAILNEPNVWLNKLPTFSKDAHKYDKGHLIVVGGTAAMSGAARLAARAGLRMGAGLVTTACPKAALEVYAEHQLSVMTIAYDEGAYDDDVVFDEVIKSKKCSALVIGPGKGVSGETRGQVLAVLKTGLPAVLDADALSSFKGSPDELFESLHENVVLTPHVGEFRRLFPDIDPIADPILATKQAAKRAGCIVLLKGAATIISDTYASVIINNHATYHLATAGSGDVLSGIIGGLMAQKMAVFDAASAGAWIHGEAAMRLGRGLIAEDLVEELPEILRQLLP